MISRRLSQFVVGLKYEDLPKEVVQLAKTCVRDAVGVALFASRHTPWGQMITQYAAVEGSGGSCTLIGVGNKASPSLAALANGTCMLGFELEDLLTPSHVHIGPPVISAAFAAAEAGHRTGKDLITAIVAGYELAGRVGRAAGKAFATRGNHATACHAVFGSVAAAGKLMGLNETQMVNALGLAGNTASGLVQSPHEGAMARRLFGGRPDQSGVMSAQLAALGFTGPEEVLEGRYGYYRALGEEIDFSQLTAGLGESFQISGIGFKAYSSCRAFHSSIDALLAIRQQHPFQPDDVAKIIGRLRPITVAAHARKDPQTVAGAQYSLPFTLASLTLSGKVSPDEYTEERLRDPSVRAMAQKVDVEFSQELEALIKDEEALPGKVTVVLKDGRSFTEERFYSKGEPQNPMTEEELRQKYHTLASKTLTPAKVRQLEEAIAGLEQLGNVTQLSELLEP